MRFELLGGLTVGIAVTAMTGCQKVEAPAAVAAPAVSSAVRKLPAVETSCSVSSDCAVFDETTTGPDACCPGCVPSVANSASIEAFRAACKASPAPSCPLLGCIMPILRPACVAGRCVSAG